MAKRALRKAEEIAAIPMDQSVELDLSDDPIVKIEPDIEVIPEKEKPSKIKDEPELSEREVSLQKQLDDLKKAESARKDESDRLIREAQERARELEQQNSQHQNSQLEAEYDSVLNAIAAAESDANAASQSYETAAALGDFKAMAEQQRKMSRAEARLESLEQGKSVLEVKREQAKTASKQDQRSAPQSENQRFEAAIAPLPDIAKQWLRKNPDYMTSQRMNIKLQAAHLDVLDAGIQAYTPAYIEAIEQKLGLKTPASDDDDEPEPARRMSVSAPVSRDTPSLTTGKTTPTKVTLTAEEREVARSSMPGTDPGEAERIYAQNKLKLIQAKRDGHYGSRDN